MGHRRMKAPRRFLLGLTAVAALVLVGIPGLGMGEDLPQTGVPQTVSGAVSGAPRSTGLTGHTPSADCGSCHFNQALVGPDRYVNQEAFAATYHYRKASELLGRALKCQDCHVTKSGKWVAHPSDNFVPSPNPAEITNDADQTCGKCHGGIAADFKHSLHGTTRGVLNSLTAAENADDHIQQGIGRSAYQLWAGIDPADQTQTPGHIGRAQCSTCHAACSDCHMTGGNQQSAKQLGANTDPYLPGSLGDDQSGNPATGQGGYLGTDYPMNPGFIMTMGMPVVQPDGSPMMVPNAPYAIDGKRTAANALKASFYPYPMMRGGGSALLFKGYSPDEARMDIASHNIVLPRSGNREDGAPGLSRDSSIAMCWRCHARTTPEYVGTFLAYMPFDATAAFGWKKQAEPSVHYQAGMVCVDCHKGTEIHGDKDKPAIEHTTDAVNVKCESCHVEDAPPVGLDDKFVTAAKKIVNSHETVECSACHSEWNHNCVRCHPVEGKDVNYLDPRHERAVMSLDAIAVTDETGERFLKYFGRNKSGKVQTMARIAMFDKSGGYWLRGFHSIQRAPDGEGKDACIACHTDKTRMLVDPEPGTRNANPWEMESPGVPEAYIDPAVVAKNTTKTCSHCHSTSVHSAAPLVRNCVMCHGSVPLNPHEE